MEINRFRVCVCVGGGGGEEGGRGLWVRGGERVVVIGYLFIYLFIYFHFISKLVRFYYT